MVTVIWIYWLIWERGQNVALHGNGGSEALQLQRQSAAAGSGPPADKELQAQRGLLNLGSYLISDRFHFFRLHNAVPTAQTCAVACLSGECLPRRLHRLGADHQQQQRVHHLRRGKHMETGERPLLKT